jgi:DnaJ-class molecular chaperone
MVICNICKGKKVVESDNKTPQLCPKCEGKGKMESLKEEKENKNKVIMHD